MAESQRVNYYATEPHTTPLTDVMTEWTF